MQWKKQWVIDSLNDAREGRRALLAELCETEPKSTRFVIGRYMTQLIECDVEIEFLERVLELDGDGDGDGNIDDSIEQTANEFVQQLAEPPKYDIMSVCADNLRRDFLLRVIRKYYHSPLYNIVIAPKDDDV